MIVVDASAAALLFGDPTADARVIEAHRALTADPAWAVPEHWHTEVFSTLRGLWLGRKMSDEQATNAVDALSHLVVAVTPTAPLLPRMWQLRSAVSGYDAAYLACAELHECSLVTADARLARSNAGRCKIELIA